MNLLLIEDESRVADFISRGLQAEGWTVEHYLDGESAIAAFNNGQFDVILLDLMLPGISGQEVCKKLRARGCTTPILMLSALDATEERVTGLRIGADDYLSKPFDFDELVARIEALARRERRFEQLKDETTVCIGGICLNKRSLQVSVHGRAIDLTAKEREVLTYLLSNPGRAIARERLLNAVWGAQADPLTNVVDVYVGRLRKKLAPCGDLIETVRGHGYLMNPDTAGD